MDYEFTPGYVGIKIKTTASIAKSISIIRKYNPVSMAEIKTAIESNEYVLTCRYTSHPGIRKIKKCYDELVKAGNEVEIYEHDRLAPYELLSNLIASHRQTDREVLAQVDAEVAAEGGDEE
jgi:hypothetical protein